MHAMNASWALGFMIAAVPNLQVSSNASEGSPAYNSAIGNLGIKEMSDNKLCVCGQPIESQSDMSLTSNSKYFKGASVAAAKEVGLVPVQNAAAGGAAYHSANIETKNN